MSTVVVMLYKITGAFLTVTGSDTLSNTLLNTFNIRSSLSIIQHEKIFPEVKPRHFGVEVQRSSGNNKESLRKLHLDPQLTQLVEREDFILFNSHENFTQISHPSKGTSKHVALYTGCRIPI
jgi:hypothetical protein